MDIKSYRRITLSKLLHYIGVNALRFASPSRRTALIVLCYHRVLDADSPARFVTEAPLVTSTHAFECQMELIAQRFHAVTLTQAVQWLEGNRDLPNRAVLITFDDGWSDTYSNAYPVMKRLGLPGVVFLATGFIGTSMRQWAGKVHDALLRTMGAEAASREIDRLKHMPVHERTALIERLSPAEDLPGENMSWRNVEEMAANGFEFGSHTRNHVILPHEPGVEILDELISSSEDIRVRLGLRPAALAYPDGQYDAFTCRQVDEAGYLCAFTCDEGLWTKRSRRYAIPRLSIHDGVCASPKGEFSSVMFLTYLAGSIPWRYRRCGA